MKLLRFYLVGNSYSGPVCPSLYYIISKRFNVPIRLPSEVMALRIGLLDLDYIALRYVICDFVITVVREIVPNA
jgi:hypothetical protein